MKKLILIATVLMLCLSLPVQAAEQDQVDTIVGNGTASQGTYTLDHPRNLELWNGSLYFIDGTHKSAKLRVWNGTKNRTVVDLAKSPLVKKDKQFVSTGLATAGDNLYVSSYTTLFKVNESRLTGVDVVNRYMKEHSLLYIYRMERFQDKLYLMCYVKANGGSYSFITYDPQNSTVEPLLDEVWFSSPTNFYPDSEGILVSTEAGEIWYEKLFPREEIKVLDTNQGSILDAWTSQGGYLQYSILQDRVKNVIYRDPRDSTSSDSKEVIAGGTRGAQDGIRDEVQMDGAKDFLWDGSGYLFADVNNNRIRKIWLDDPPTSAV